MEGLASLGINVSALIAQVINIAILFGLLYLVAYKPLMRMLDERSNKVKESMEQTEYIKEQVELTEKETAKRIQEASKEGQKIIDRSMKVGEEAKHQAQKEAKEKAQALIAEASVEIKQERDKAIDELRKEVADLAIMAAGKVVGQMMDKETNRKLIDQVLEQATELKKD